MREPERRNGRWAGGRETFRFGRGERFLGREIRSAPNAGKMNGTGEGGIGREKRKTDRKFLRETAEKAPVNTRWGGGGKVRNQSVASSPWKEGTREVS